MDHHILALIIIQGSDVGKLQTYKLKYLFFRKDLEYEFTRKTYHKCKVCK